MKTIKTNGVIIPSVTFFEPTDSGWQLLDDLELTGGFYQSGGEFDANDHNVTVGGDGLEIYPDSSNVTLRMGSGNWNLDDSWFSVYDGETYTVTVIPETSTINMSNGGGFYTPGKTFNDISLTGGGEFDFLGGITFNSFESDSSVKTIKIEGGSTLEVSSFIVSGTAGNLITLDSILNGENSNSYEEDATELATNGGFTGNANGWNLTEGFTYNDNNVISSGGDSSMTQSLTFTKGKAYRVYIDLSGTSGEVTIGHGSGNSFNTQTIYESGYLDFFVYGSGDLLYIATYDDGVIIDNVSVKELKVKQHILTKSSGIVECDYLDISNSNAGGGATWYAGKNSNDTLNNDGWIFTGVPVDTDDERDAKTLGQASTNSERLATTRGGLQTDSSRSSKTTGKAAASNTRDAKTTGKAAITSERSAKTTGKTTSTSERSAKVSGKTTSFSERDSKVTGKLTTTSERSAKTTGKDTSNSERDAKTLGKATSNSTRDSKVTGKDTTTSERQAKVTGKPQSTDVADERSAKLTGIGITFNVRNAKVTGKDTSSSERPAKTYGKDDSLSERSATLKGKAVESSERAAKTHGRLDTLSERQATLQGQNNTSSEVSAKTTGKNTSFSEISAKTHGKDTASSETPVKVTGKDFISDERQVKTHGKDSATSEIPAKTHGKDSTTSERNVKTTGVLTTDSERSAKTHGVDTTDSERQTKTHGKAAASSEKEAKVTGKNSSNSERRVRLTGKGPWYRKTPKPFKTENKPDWKTKNSGRWYEDDPKDFKTKTPKQFSKNY